MSQQGEDLLSRIGRIVERDFSQRILRKCQADESIEVLDVSIRPATNKGDNYTSDMFRASIRYSSSKSQSNEKTLIVKVEPLLEGAQHDMIAKSSLFPTEIAMMTDTLARMNELLQASDNTAKPLNGRGLYTQASGPPMLVMEDLAPLGFRMADRQAGLNLDHCLLAVRNLARFHASSLALCEREPQQKERYARGMFNQCQPSEMRQFFLSGTRQLAAEAATWTELDPSIPPKIRKMADGIYERGCEACVCRDDEFNVINHGDFWVNNMLFRYDQSGRPVAHIFVDFQLCLYTSPGVDLNYFFNTSLTDETLRLHEETLICEYTRSLERAMIATGCRTKSPKIEQVKQMVQDRAAYGMIAAFAILPLLLASDSETRDLNELLSDNNGTDEEARNPAYSGLLYRKAMLERLPRFDRMGLLD